MRHPLDPLVSPQAVARTLVPRLEAGEPEALALTPRVVTALRERRWAGDDVLADDLEARLEDRWPGEGVTVLPVDVEELADALESDPDQGEGALDLRTGEVLPGYLLDADVVGDDVAVDVEEEPERWLWLDGPSSRDAYHDMEDFAALRPDHERRRLERVLDGRGAFRRFADAVDQLGLTAEWMPLREERRTGRARQWLAGHGLRVGEVGPRPGP